MDDLVQVANFDRKRITKSEIEKLKNQMILMARNYCPRDTSNMAENAIYVVNTSDGFKIVWNDKFANYMPYVNEGKHPFSQSPRILANKQFVERGIAGCAYLLDQFFKDENYIMFSNKARKSPLALKFLHQMQKGETLLESDKNYSKMITRLVKSIQKNANSRTLEEPDNYQEIFDLDKEQVYEESI